LQVKLILFVTYDLIKELLSYGEYVKVLQPESLVEEMKQNFSCALSHYR
jgi:predicted DNA-binding transcriptional regulator YafY